MINTFTKDQESQLSLYRDKWINIGLSTEQLPIKNIEKIVSTFNKNVLKEKEKPILVFNSPIESWYFLNWWMFNKNLTRSQVGSQIRSQVELQVRSQVESQVGLQVGSQVGSQVRSQVRSQVGSQVWSQVWSQVELQVESQVRSQVESQVRSQVESQVWSQVESQVESQVWLQVWSQVWSQVESQVRSQVRSQVWSQVRSQVESQVESQVRSQVWSQVESQVRSQVESQVSSLKLIDFIYPYLLGSFNCSYFSYVDFYTNVIKLKNLPQDELIKNYLDTSKVGFIFPLEDIIIVCQKPNLIKKNNNGLHCVDGPALTYNDNGLTEIYALNGVRMTKEYVMTPGEQISAKTVFEEKNVEVRRELLRKIGIEKFLEIAPHKSLDKQGNYELFSIELSEQIKDAKYLKMVNPSVGCFHLEGVAPECKTVEHALNWRTYQDINKSWKPAILT